MSDCIRVMVRLGKIQSYIFGRFRSFHMNDSAKQLRGRSLLVSVLPEILFKEIPGVEIETSAAGTVVGYAPAESNTFLASRTREWEKKVWELGIGDLTLDVIWMPWQRQGSSNDAQNAAWQRKVGRSKLQRWSHILESPTLASLGRECARCGRRHAALVSNVNHQKSDEPEDLNCDFCDMEIQLGASLLRDQGAQPQKIHVDMSGERFEIGCVRRPGTREVDCTRSVGDWRLPARDHRPLSFEELASLEGDEGPMDGRGHLAMLKMDVDHLGKAFGTIRDGTGTDAEKFEKRKALSEALIEFFGFELPKALSSPISDAINGRTLVGAQNFIYPLFAGGDDLVLIGPAASMLSVAIEINRRFREHFTKDSLTLSAGYVRFKQRWPVPKVHSAAESLEKEAKLAGRNRIAISDVSIPHENGGRYPLILTWEEARQAMQRASQLLPLWTHADHTNRLATSWLHDMMPLATDALEWRMTSTAESHEPRWFWTMQYSVARAMERLNRPEAREAFDKAFRQPIELLALNLLESARASPMDSACSEWAGWLWSMFLVSNTLKGGSANGVSYESV